MVRALLALHLASDELERAQRVEVERLAAAGFPGARGGLGGQQRHAERAHEVAVLVHDHVHAQLVAERLHHAGVLAHTALEHHGRSDLLAFAHVVQVVRGHRAAQACDDVLARVAHLDLVHEVALGEYGAARRDVRGLLRGQRDVAELFHLHAQPMRLARQECARARRAQRIHGVVHGDAVFHADDFRVLAADLQDGAYVGV